MKPEPAALLAELVACPSPSGEEAAVAALVAGRLDRCGFETRRVGDSVVAEAGPAGAPVVLLCSHLDTVPAGPSWTADPHAARWEGDRLTGLGANDAKAAVAAMIQAGTDWLAAGAPGGLRLRLAFTACEETSNRGIEEVIAACGLPDAAVVGEPTGLAVVRAQSGLGVLEAEWTGTSCHAGHAGRVEHRNALLAAAHDLASFPRCLEIGAPHPLCGPSTVVATVLRAGERHNRVPDRAVATFDARLAPGVGADDAAAALSGLLPRATVSVRSARLRPFETPAASPVVRAALEAAGGNEAEGSCTLSDMALLQGVPAVKCGPGRTERSHTPDEWVTRAELDAGVRFYARFLERVPSALAGAVA